MSNLTVRANSLGTGTVILESPNTNTNQTITLPDATTTLVGTDATQTLTNKTLNGGALTLMTAQASTSGTSIDFTGIPSWAKRVTVVFNGVSVSGTDLLLVQGGSGSFETSGYSCSAGNRGNEAISTTGFLVNYNAAPSATWAWSGTAILNLISANTWIMTSIMAVGGLTGPSFAAGVKSFSGVLDRVRITPFGSNTFDAGSINVMYEG